MASRALLAGLAVAATLALLLTAAAVPFLGSDPAFGLHDAGPQGLTRLAQLAESEVGGRGGGVTARTLATGPLALALLPDAEVPRTLYVAAGVLRSPSGDEAEALRAFVERGGRVLLADDVGHGGLLAAPFGIQFTGQRLYDERSRDGDASFVEATMRADQAYTPVLLNVPTALFADRNATPSCVRVLGESSPRSYVDTNGDGRLDVQDQRGPFTVGLAVVPGARDCAQTGPLGCDATAGGCAVFLADSGMLLNGVLTGNLSTEYRNDEFLVGLLRELLPQGGTLLVDESLHQHGAASAVPVGVFSALVTAARTPVLLIPLAAAIALAGGAAAWRLGRAPDWRHHHRPDEPTHVTRATVATREDESP